MHDAVILVSNSVIRGNEKTAQDWRYESAVMPHILTITKNLEKYLLIHDMDIALIDPLARLAQVYREWGMYAEAAGIQGRLVELPEIQSGSAVG